jgi:hypothetical protein
MDCQKYSPASVLLFLPTFSSSDRAGLTKRASEDRLQELQAKRLILRVAVKDDGFRIMAHRNVSMPARLFTPTAMSQKDKPHPEVRLF